MSKIIGLDGAPISRSTNNAVEGENLVECVIELSDIENLRKAKPIQIQTPNGVVSIPPERMLPELLGQLFQFMNATEQKQLTVTITDKSSKLVLEKQIQMRLAHKPMSDDPISIFSISWINGSENLSKNTKRNTKIQHLYH